MLNRKRVHKKLHLRQPSSKILSEIPKDFVPATYNDFILVDTKKKTWLYPKGHRTYKDGLEFVLLSFYDNTSIEMYTTGININHRNQGLGFLIKLSDWIEAGKCFIHKSEVYVKPLSKTALRNKLISNELDF
jgi:hypothetical protein